MIQTNDWDAATSEDEPNYLPARMLNEFVYCPRLYFLEHVEGLFEHNVDTIKGAALHKRVDKKTDSLPAGKSGRGRRSTENTNGDPSEKPDTIHARSVMLSSDHYGIIAKMDLVEATGDLATPVDYKRGKPKTADDGSLTAWDPERVQLCAQALVLRENVYRCDEGVIFFWETRQRVRIPIDDALIQLTTEAIAAALQMRQCNELPPPLSDSPKCPRCSLVSICLPDETSFCATATPRETDDAAAGGMDDPRLLSLSVGPSTVGQPVQTFRSWFSKN